MVRDMVLDNLTDKLVSEDKLRRPELGLSRLFQNNENLN